MNERHLLERLFVFTAFRDHECPRDLKTRLTAAGAIAEELLARPPRRPLVILGQGTSQRRIFPN